jgi:hypothetical protein
VGARFSRPSLGPTLPPKNRHWVSFSGLKRVGVGSWPLITVYCRGYRKSRAISLLLLHNFMAWTSKTYKHILPSLCFYPSACPRISARQPLDLCFSNSVPRNPSFSLRGVRGSERRMCVMAECFYRRSKI